MKTLLVSGLVAISFAALADADLNAQEGEAGYDTYVEDTLVAMAHVKQYNPLILNAWMDRYITVIDRCYHEVETYGVKKAYLSGYYCPWIISDTEFTAYDNKMMAYYEQVKSNPKQTMEWLMAGDTQMMINYKILKYSFHEKSVENIKQLCRTNRKMKDSELC